MKRKLLLINIVLLALVLLIGTVVRDEWRDYRHANDVTKIRPAKLPNAPKAPQQPVGQIPPLPQMGVYNAVFERSLFSPTRTEFAPVAVTQAPPPPPQMPGKPTLIGVTMIDEKKIAFIQEPQIGGAPPQSRTVQIGDSVMVHGKVVEIRPAALVFTWPGDVTETVDLLGSDGSPRARVAAAQVLQTNVVSVGGGKGGKKVAAAGAAAPAAVTPPAGGAPTVQVSAVGGAHAPTAGTRGRPSGLSRGGTAGTTGAAGTLGTTPGLRQQIPGQYPQQYPQQNPQQYPQQTPGYIDTPFGRIPRQPRRN